MVLKHLLEELSPEMEGDLVSIRRSKFLKRIKRETVRVSLRSNYLILHKVSIQSKSLLTMKVVPPISCNHKSLPSKSLKAGENDSQITKDSRIINLHGAIVSLFSEKGMPNGFQLEFIDEKKQGKEHKAILLCSSQKSAMEWVLAIQKSCVAEPLRRSDFDHYFLLGKGHFGKVSLVKHRKTDTVLALKEISEERFAVDSIVSKKKGKVSKSLSELRLEKQISERVLLANLVDNPFISRLAFAFRENGKLYLASEFNDRGDLWTMIRSKKRVNVQSMRFLISQVVVGIDSLHAHGIVHRDIKLENIMLDSFGRVKIVDLGLSKQLTERESSTREDRRYGYTFSLCGTSYYQPPELITGVGHRLEVDWWQIGCLMYELVVGKPAFFEKTQKLVHQKILDRSSLDTATFANILGANQDSLNALDLLIGLLTHDSSERLGARGASQIMEHPFFESVDWSKVKAQEVVPTIEIKEYLTIGGESQNVLDREVIAKFFKDAKTLGGETLNESIKACPLTDERKLVMHSGHSSANSYPSSEGASSSDSVTIQSSRSGDVSVGKKGRIIKRPTIPIDAESAGPLLGFQFSAPSHVMEKFCTGEIVHSA